MNPRNGRAFSELEIVELFQLIFLQAARFGKVKHFLCIKVKWAFLGGS